MGLVSRNHVDLTFEKSINVIHHIKLKKKNCTIILIDVDKTSTNPTFLIKTPQELGMEHPQPEKGHL